MTAARRIVRRFPDYGWAWPRGDLDSLLKAALLTDEVRAFNHAMQWLNSHDIDHVAFREKRLLTAISERFGRRLAVSSAQPRLAGLQRLLWTQSRLALRDAREGLSALAENNIPYMLIKGASRIALDPGVQRSRISHDVDILVRPENVRSAFKALLDKGWNAASGAGPLSVLNAATRTRAMNFLKGKYGDIDVHQFAYQALHHSEQDEELLWQRSVPVALDGVPARAPAASDRIALAIAHGALDAHTHSDWLIDIADAIQSGNVDWNALIETLKRRHILVPAASALTYLAQEIGLSLPNDAMRRLVEDADAEGLLARTSLLECKPRTDFTLLSGAARGIAKQIRLRHGIPPARQLVMWRAWLARPVNTQKLPKAELGPVRVSIKPGSSAIVEIALQVSLPAVRRRFEIEMSTENRHLATLRHRKHSRLPGGVRELVFRGPVELLPDEDALFLEARPARFMRESKDERYAALPFSISRISIGGERLDLTT